MSSFPLFRCVFKVGIEGVEYVSESECCGFPSGRIGVADCLAQRVHEQDGVRALLQDAASVDLTGHLVNGVSSLAAAFVQLPDDALGVAESGQLLVVHIEHSEAGRGKDAWGDESIAQADGDIGT